VIGPNLSEWAIKRPSLIVYAMIVALVAGTMAFLKLGRAEDPAFTFRTMIVSAAWPGATIDETLKQVTERIERTLQETDHLDGIRSYTTAGQTVIFVDLKGTTPPDVVPDVWYQVRKNVGDMRGTLPAGVVGPGFNDDFGDTFGIIYGFTADGFTFRELRARGCSASRTSRRSRCSARRTSRSSSSSRPSGSRASGSTSLRSRPRCSSRTSSGRRA
jgi:multidrug efflux pump